MASACVNNIGVSQEKFPPASYQSYGWLSPRISFSRDDDTSKNSKTTTATAISDEPPPDTDDSFDFEFRLDDPITMLPADELFSDGKLIPLQTTIAAAAATAVIKPASTSSTNNVVPEIKSPETVKTHRSLETEVTGANAADSYLFSPKAPRCSSRWKELLGLKKLYQNPKPETQKSVTAATTTTTMCSSSNPSSSTTSLTSTNSRSLKRFLHRSSKSCSYGLLSSSNSLSLDHSLSLPLLKDSDCESVSISSSRLSLSSSCSSHEHEDLPRLSLDSDKPISNLTMLHSGPNPFVLNRNCNRNANQNPPRMRLVKSRENGNVNGCCNGSNSRVGRSSVRRRSVSGSGETSRGVSVDSPRMNSSGKIVFQSLERSSSSPSSFNGGPRYKHRGVERSYSANVRVTPVLNVPVCSLRGGSKSGSVFGFGQLFSSSPQKRESGFTNKGHHHQQQQSGNRRARD